MHQHNAIILLAQWASALLSEEECTRLFLAIATGGPSFARDLASGAYLTSDTKAASRHSELRAVPRHGSQQLRAVMEVVTENSAPANPATTTGQMILAVAGSLMGDLVTDVDGENEDYELNFPAFARATAEALAVAEEINPSTVAMRETVTALGAADTAFLEARNATGVSMDVMSEPLNRFRAYGGLGAVAFALEALDGREPDRAGVVPRGLATLARLRDPWRQVVSR